MGPISLATAQSPRPRPRPRSRTTALLALASALACAAALAGASRAHAAEAGVNVSNPSAAQLAQVQALGTHWMRMFVGWSEVEPARGSYNALWFAAYEKLSRELPAGTKVILDVVDSPAWETGSTNVHAPPANPNDYAAFIANLAQRLGSRVAAYEIWNEEDESRWWPGSPDAAAYVRLLRAAYPAVKRAEPKATVVMGGLTGNDYPFLESVYAAGGRGYFDAVGVHTDTACNKLSPYEFIRGTDNRLLVDSFLAYREVHQTMIANGDEKPIWMTETSWRTTTAPCSEGAWKGVTAEGVSESEQATFLREAYHCMKEDPYVTVALWFPLQDEHGVLSGLMRSNGSFKPSFAAMRDYAHEGDKLTEPCGVFTGPRIAVRTPANNVHYAGVLPISVSATSSIGVFRITLKVDGRLIRNFGHHSYPSTLVGSMNWFGAHHIPLGRHTLTFLAYDKARNVSETSITIVRVPPAKSAAHHHGAGPGTSGHTATGKHKSKRKHHKRKRRRRRHH
jgi:hypothetical protein